MTQSGKEQQLKHKQESKGECLPMYDTDGFAEVFKLMVDKGASDLHLAVSSPPVLRIDGRLMRLQDLPTITAEDVEMVLEHIATPEQVSTFLTELELDFAYSVAGLARFRVSVLQQRGTMSLAFRLVPSNVPSVDELGLPQICKQLVLKLRGLILVTDPTGKVKSTTLAAMLTILGREGHNMPALFHIRFVTTPVAGRRCAKSYSAALP